MRTEDGTHALEFWPCVRPSCPCTASWNGERGEHCCRACLEGTPCGEPEHVRPSTWKDASGCKTPSPKAPSKKGKGKVKAAAISPASELSFELGDASSPDSMLDDLASASDTGVGEERPRSRRLDTGDGLSVYVRNEDMAAKRTGEQAVQSQAFQTASQHIARKSGLRKTLAGLRNKARASSEADELFANVADAVKSSDRLAVGLLSDAVCEPRGASAQPYVCAVVAALREVQSELVLMVTKELREVMGFDSEVEALARAIVYGNGRSLTSRS